MEEELEKINKKNELIKKSVKEKIEIKSLYKNNMEIACEYTKIIGILKNINYTIKVGDLIKYCEKFNKIEKNVNMLMYRTVFTSDLTQDIYEEVEKNKTELLYFLGYFRNIFSKSGGGFKPL